MESHVCVQFVCVRLKNINRNLKVKVEIQPNHEPGPSWINYTQALKTVEEQMRITAHTINKPLNNADM